MILLVDWCRASLLTAHHTICTSNLLSLLLEATSLAHTPLPWELGLWIPVLAWPVALNSLFDIQLTDRLRKTAPFVAGSAALVIQAKGRSAAIGLGMRDLFQSTAAPVASSKTDSDPLQTLSQAGSGLIQVDSAILTKTIVSPGQFTLNDTANFKPV